jgi:signal transduction histidine kinase
LIIAFLIAIIGIIPIVLAICVLKIYKGSELAFALFLYMLSISFWQLDIAVLYLKGVLSEELITWLFRFFRIGPTFMIPLVFYLAYVLINKHTTNIKNHFYKFQFSIFNPKVLFFLVVWSFIVYLINMTRLGIIGVNEVKIINSDLYFYFPEYGPLQFLYLFHTSSFFILIIFTFIISRQIQNLYLKNFLGTFSYCSVLLFIFGLLNFIPGTGALFSSLGTIIFSVIIVFSFVKLNTMLTVNYNRLMERQKKLDNAGSLAASLVHEVKNTLQIINGYSKLLGESHLPSDGKKMTVMIQKAANQMEDLLNNYTKLLKYKSIDYQMVDLNEIIQQTIEISAEFLQRNDVEVVFDKKYSTLKTYANQAYLKQVFVNLIKNSSEAFPKESSIRIITISTDIQVDRIIINIIDTGKGIPADHWNSIFDPFTTSKNEGLGLGLPFVKNIILEHRGDINVVDSSSKGTHIQIILPQYSFSNL